MNVAEFKEALKKVYENDLDKIIAQKYRDWTKPKRYLAQEKKRAKRDREILKYVEENTNEGIAGASFIALVNEIRSAEVLKNVLCYMITGKKGDDKE